MRNYALTIKYLNAVKICNFALAQQKQFTLHTEQWNCTKYNEHVYMRPVNSKHMPSHVMQSVDTQIDQVFGRIGNRVRCSIFFSSAVSSLFYCCAVQMSLMHWITVKFASHRNLAEEKKYEWKFAVVRRVIRSFIRTVSNWTRLFYITISLRLVSGSL